MTEDQIAQHLDPEFLALWYMEATGTGIRPRRVAKVGTLLYVLPRYRWTKDDDCRPNEGEVEFYDLRNIYGEVEDTLPLDQSPLRDVPELEDQGDYEYSPPAPHRDCYCFQCSPRLAWLWEPIQPAPGKSST